MTRPFSTTHTPKTLRKMSTPALHRLYTHLYNESFFNPYEERPLMLIALIGHFDSRTNSELGKLAQNRKVNQQSAIIQYEQMVSGRKYTDSQVVTARAMRDEGASFRVIQAAFNGSLKGVEKMVKGMTYQTTIGSTLVPTIPGLFEYRPLLKLTVKVENSTDAWLTALGF